MSHGTFESGDFTINTSLVKPEETNMNTYLELQREGENTLYVILTGMQQGKKNYSQCIEYEKTEDHDTVSIRVAYPYGSRADIAYAFVRRGYAITYGDLVVIDGVLQVKEENK